MDVVLGGKYRAIRQLGSGGMGTVYEALAPDGARVAVKVLHENASETVLARFKREAQAASGLDHPNIVRVVDFSADPSFLVMELLEGEALAVVVDREGSISASRAAHVGVQLLDALAAAHRAGIVHRDVKPANVMLCPSPSQDFVKLVDFGIAKVPDFSTKLTRTGNPVGTLATMAPEQLLDLDVDGRADVYAVGATLYHAVAGRYPFAIANTPQLMRAICSAQPEPLASLCTEVDEAFAAIVERALAKDPSRRYASADEMAAALRAWMRERTVVAAPPRSARVIPAPSAPELPRIGDFLLGKFRIDRVVGRGGMGIVYEARHDLLEQSVALKLLTRSVTAESTTRFVNEAKLAARIRSDHVPRVFDVGILPTGVPYIAMDLLRGRDLATLLHTRGPLEVAEATRYALQALDALAQAHALEIVHRDLKPSNLFLETSDGVKVLDFGISKAEDRAHLGLTPSGTLVGSPCYMAPEQIRDANDVDARADIWAMGVVLHELLAGRNPFESSHTGEVFMNVLERDPPPIGRPDVPRELEAVIRRCLRRARDERYPNVLELARALAPFAAGRHDERLARIAAATLRPGSVPDLRPASEPVVPSAATVPAWTGSVVTFVPRARRRWLVGVLAAGALGVASVPIVGRMTQHHASAAASAPAEPPAAQLVTPPPAPDPAPVPAPEPIADAPDAAPLSPTARPHTRPSPPPRVDRKKVLEQRGD